LKPRPLLSICSCSYPFRVGRAYLRMVDHGNFRAQSELVCAMRAETHDVLQEDLVVGFVEAGLVARELQPETGELRRREIDHRRGALWIVFGKPREVGCREHAAVYQADIRRSAAELFIAQSEAPTRHELIGALHVPTRLAGTIDIGKVCASAVESQPAVFSAMQVFGLEPEVAIDRVAVRRPLPDKIHAPHLAVAGERVGDWRTERI